MEYKYASEEEAEIDLMIKLAFVSYAGCYNPWGAGVDLAVKHMVKKLAPSQKMVWGPECSGNWFDLFTTTLAYIVVDKESEEAGKPIYTLVIRGTNALSWSSVVFQDIAIHELSPWKLASPKAQIAKKLDPSISKGGALTLRDLNALKAKRKSIVDFLADKATTENAQIRVTGHSLGGMAAMMYPVWLMDEFRGRGIDIDGRFSTFPIAGLTPGNKDFATYTEKMFADHNNSYLRLASELDFATKLWLQDVLGTEVPTMYEPESTPGKLDKEILQFFYNNTLNREYTHPKNHKKIPAELASIKSWFFQFIYQHLVPYIEYVVHDEERDKLMNMVSLELAKRNPLAAVAVHRAAKKRFKQEGAEAATLS